MNGKRQICPKCNLKVAEWEGVPSPSGTKQVYHADCINSLRNKPAVLHCKVGKVLPLEEYKLLTNRVQ